MTMDKCQVGKDCLNKATLEIDLTVNGIKKTYDCCDDCSTKLIEALARKEVES